MTEITGLKVALTQLFISHAKLDVFWKDRIETGTPVGGIQHPAWSRWIPEHNTFLLPLVFHRNSKTVTDHSADALSLLWLTVVTNLDHMTTADMIWHDVTVQWQNQGKTSILGILFYLPCSSSVVEVNPVPLQQYVFQNISKIILRCFSNVR